MNNIYQTKTMLGAIKQMEPVHSALRDRYVVTGANDLFPTDEVLVEYKDGSNRKMAPVVINGKSGITVGRNGYKTFRMEPPMVAPKRTLTVDDLRKKGFGEELFSDMTPEQRQAALLAQDLTELDEMHTNREEFIVSKLLFGNGYTLKQYADEYGGENFEEYVMKFYEGDTNPAVYVPGAKWTATGSDKMADLHIMARMLTTAGNNAADVLLGADAADALMDDAKIKELMDLNRYDAGQIAPQLMADGMALLGVLNVRGRRLNLITYDGTYEDEQTGAITPYIPAKSICVTAPGCIRGLYGCVTQLEQADNQFHSYMGRRVPRYTANIDSDTRELRLASKPLFVPMAKNPFISAAVLD